MAFALLEELAGGCDEGIPMNDSIETLCLLTLPQAAKLLNVTIGTLPSDDSQTGTPGVQGRWTMALT